MDWNIMFLANSILLGVGLAMDAFSVSLANGLHEPKMKAGRMCAMAGVFAAFQYLMPMLGWFCVHTIAHYFKIFEKFIPWIALILLCYIGINMIKESKECEEEEGCCGVSVGFGGLMLQGVATSIDALSVGFTIAEYIFWHALLACAIIGIITFGICLLGLYFGRKFGTKLAGKAGILGGCILIFIGIEIFVKGVILS